MTLSASDWNPGFDKLSKKSRKMLELGDAIFEEWEKRVRASISEAVILKHPVLIDTLPVLIGNIAEALTPGYPRASTGIAVPTVASEHGGERARLTNYNLSAIISEYQILRSTIFDVLKNNGVHLEEGEILTINSAFDTIIKEAVTAFALAQSALREQFVAALTHDLRNPLATISTAGELILRTADPEKINALAMKVVKSAGRMDRMIRDLLDTIVFQSGERLHLQLSRFDMLEVVKEVCEQFTAVHGERFQLQGESVIGWWGRDAIKRALENLMDNAVKYGAADGVIRINVATAHERAMITVHNDGDPIPPEQMEAVFQVFRRAEAVKKGRKTGWGIGLPYVRSVAESHGGSVGVDGSVNRGTNFMLDLPVDARAFQDAPVLEKIH